MPPDQASNGTPGRRAARGRDLAAASRTAPEAREARLTADSGDRAGRGGPRVLVFVHAGTVVALEAVRPAGALHQTVSGAITPAPPAHTLVRTRGRGRAARALTDPAGRFTLGEVESGPFSLTLAAPGPDDPPVVTEWVVL